MTKPNLPKKKRLLYSHYNLNRIFLIWIALYEAAMIKKLTGFIPEKDAKSLAPHLDEVDQSKTVKKFVKTSKDLYNAFEVVRKKKLSPRHSPELEKALEPVRKTERRNLNTLWLSLGRAEGLRFLSDLLDQFTLNENLSAITVRKIGQIFFGPSSTSGKARAFNHLLIHQLFGTVEIFQDGTQNNAHQVRFTEEGLQWYFEIYEKMLHLSKDFYNTNHIHLGYIHESIKDLGSRRTIKNIVVALTTTFVFAPNAYVPDVYASETDQISTMYYTSYAKMPVGLPDVGEIDVNGSGTVTFGEGSAWHCVGGGASPRIAVDDAGIQYTDWIKHIFSDATGSGVNGSGTVTFAEGPAWHRFGDGTSPLLK